MPVTPCKYSLNYISLFLFVNVLTYIAALTFAVKQVLKSRHLLEMSTRWRVRTQARK